MVLSISEATGIKWNVLERLRFNFMLGNKQSKLLHHAPHTDNYTPHWSAIYYVHDCDGDTFFFDQKLTEFTEEESYRITNENKWTIKQRVSPKKGRLVMFDGVRFHASSFTTTNPFRCTQYEFLMINVVKQVINKQTCEVLCNSMELMRVSMGNPPDPTINNAFGYYSPVFLESLLLWMQPEIENKTGKNYIQHTHTVGYMDMDQS
ncbi:MAG: hypothetical protein CM15mV10_2670 [uncultured marine virus]|nr:MAG: hypothetical protein CM15mV10_2670 [uncultured marine virus]